MALEETLWVEKYRPRTVDECIIPTENKKILQDFVEKGDIPNIILSSSCPGTGKTTTARAIASQLGYDTMFINASMENGIDVLRNKIANFASTVSLTGGMKCIILDESDNLNSQSTQPALRGFIEKFSKNCRFIFTCNYINKLLPPIVSRCTVLDFSLDKADKSYPVLCKEMYKRICYILESEGVKYNKNTIIQIIAKYFPDWRRVINELQRYSAGGVIDDGIFVNFTQNNFTALVKAIQGKKFKEVREWVGANQNIDPNKLFRYFYTESDNFMLPQSIPQMILTTSEYQYKSAFVADQEINMAAYLIDIMKMCQFKE